jgi:4,5-DOPA dioxygenase extradiol
MSARMPVAFVSHGSPMALLEAPDALACWRALGEALPEPRAILAVSAHWEARLPTASLAGAPATIHDFGGFPPALYRLRYPAPGAPALAERAVALLAAAGIAADLHPDRGLDHGAWIPLSQLYPTARVPVTQLALVRGAGPAAHLALGRALALLRDEGVLIFASGAITHNFGWLERAPDAEPLPQAAAFAAWVGEKLGAGDTAVLAAYRSAPHGADAHPSEDHFLPLFVAAGAAAGDTPQRLQPRYAYGGLAMDAYVWGTAG